MGSWVSALWSLDGAFLLGEVIATAMMGVGIILESPTSPTPKQRVASSLVMVGVVGELIFSVLLFAHDGAVIDRQQKKILSLEQRLAARTMSADNQSGIAAKLRPFGGQLFEMVSYSEDQESADLASQISSTLGRAGWASRPTDVTGVPEVIAGVVVYVNDNAPAPTRSAADALMAALNEKQIATTVRGRQTNDLRLLTIFVGIKP